MLKEVALYAKDNHGSIREWKIGCYIEDGEGVIEIKHGVIDGQKSITKEYIEEGLAGRTLEEQTLSRFDSRLNKKIDSGYVRSVEEAIENKRVNPLGYPRPMTAKTYKNMANQIPFSAGVHIQRKYNGHRCLIKNDNGTLVAYSRNGKVIDSIDHILEDIEIPEGFILDGELYHHGTKFQTISSWIKRKQEETKELTYVVYDCMLPEVFQTRLEILKEFNLFDSENIMLATTNIVQSHEEANKELNKYIKDGYEGAILRLSNKKYEDGKRSKSLIKMKKFLDDEFIVVDVVSSSEGWGILSCLAKNGKKFSVSAPGDMYNKRRILEDKGEYIGRYVRVEFAELTASGLPFHPVATDFRDKGAE